jgi:hypothetical protein
VLKAVLKWLSSDIYTGSLVVLVYQYRPLMNSEPHRL